MKPFKVIKGSAGVEKGGLEGHKPWGSNVFGGMGGWPGSLSFHDLCAAGVCVATPLPSSLIGNKRPRYEKGFILICHGSWHCLAAS